MSNNKSVTVDLTMQASLDSSNSTSPTIKSSSPEDDITNLGDEERGLGPPSQALPLYVRSRASTSSLDNDTEPQTHPNSITSSTGKYIKRKTSQFLEAVTPSLQKSGNAPITPKLAVLVESYITSGIAADIRMEGEELRREQETRTGQNVNGNGAGNELPDIALETSLLRGRKRASWATQFRILSGRAFKNLYRDPALLAAHYLSSIALACE